MTEVGRILAAHLRDQIEQDFRVKSNYVTEITQLKLVVVCKNVLALKGYKDKVHQDFDVGM